MQKKFHYIVKIKKFRLENLLMILITVIDHYYYTFAADLIIIIRCTMRLVFTEFVVLLAGGLRKTEGI